MKAHVLMVDIHGRYTCEDKKLLSFLLFTRLREYGLVTSCVFGMHLSVIM